MQEFSHMNLKSELTESLKKMGFINPTEVQAQAIPVVLQGKDVVVRAKTGTGKTGAFTIPIVQMMDPRQRHPTALVIVPTRELAVQVSSVATKISSPLGFRTATVYGGASMNVQIEAIRRGASIVVGTPGRLIDLIDRGALDLRNIRFVVLDEADTMLDMGFIEDVEYIVSHTPQDKQMMMFSATMPHKIALIAEHHMKHDKEKITVGKEEEITALGIKHYYTIANGAAKFDMLIGYIKQYNPKKGIIFTSTQRSAELLHRVLQGEGFDAILMHGGLTQSMRERSLGSFKAGTQFMISTNIAARGLDIKDVTDIINFDAPEDPSVYVHRVGRSARMDKQGKAFTMFSVPQKYLVEVIKRTANIEMEQIQIDHTMIKRIDLKKYLDQRSHGGFHGRDGGRDRGRFGGHGGGYRGGRGGGDRGDRGGYGGHGGHEGHDRNDRGGYGHGMRMRRGWGPKRD